MFGHRAHPQGGYRHRQRGRRKTLKLRTFPGEVLNWIESYCTSKGASRRKWGSRRLGGALKVNQDWGRQGGGRQEKGVYSSLESKRVKFWAVSTLRRVNGNLALSRRIWELRALAPRSKSAALCSPALGRTRNPPHFGWNSRA